MTKVIPASNLAAVVDEWFRDNYSPGDYEHQFYGDSDKAHYTQSGDFYEEIMAQELGCEQTVIQALNEHLPDVSHRDIAEGAEQFYDDATLYESHDAVRNREAALEEEYWYGQRYQTQWRDFCDLVIYKRRFFGAKEELDRLFGDPDEFAKGRICPLYTLPEGKLIYRARLVDEGDALIEKIERNPSSELGAPPREKTRAGRMNVEFIPAFYAAFTQDIALAEIRPVVGEMVAIGTFQTQKPIRVFDFTAFRHSEPGDLREIVAHTRYDFIDQLEREISGPIQANDRVREYLPTQIVAEYISQAFACDAVIYRSSMAARGKRENRNIVFINKNTPFVGDAASVLSYVDFEFLEVLNVIYETANPILF